MILPVIKLILLLVTVIINGFLALLVIKNNSKSATNKIYTFLSLIIAIWLTLNFLSIEPIFLDYSLLLIRLSIFCAAPLSTFFYLLAITLPKDKIQLSKTKLYVMTFITVIVMLLAISPYTFTAVEIFNSSPHPTPGPGILPFSIVTTLFSLLAIINLVKKIYTTKGLERHQYQIVMFGIGLMLGLIITTVLLPVVILKINYFVSLIPIYTLFFLGFTTYAIIKHRLMDIRFVVARTASFTLLVLLFGLLYGVIVAISSIFFISKVLDYHMIIVSATFAISMVFAFQPLRRRFEKITDKIFYKDHYDAQKLLYDLTLIMASTLRLEDLTHQMLQLLFKEMRITKGAFILMNNDLISDVKSENFEKLPILDENEIKKLSHSRASLLIDELEEGELKNIMRKLDISAVIHMHTEGEQVGLLVLGNKASGDIYSEQDLELLEILAPEAAVAIQNAKAYEEIRRFNITLQEEIDRATIDLRKANIRLQELDKLKDEFVSFASHELRTPMTAIKGSLSTILEGYAGDVSLTARDFLTAAYNENDRLLRLVNNLLNISRIEAGKFTFTVTKVDLEKLITEVVKNLQMAVKEKNIFLKFDNQLPLPLVNADEDKVREVIINLIGNAIKFTKEGGITVGTQIDGATVRVSVMDTGPGITKADQELLFQKFSQVNGNYAKQSGGTGLGLYISKQIVEGLHGKIWLESMIGKGSSFYFSLPVA